MLTIYHEPGWCDVFTRIKIVVDDEYEFLLRMNESKQVLIAPKTKQAVIECHC